MKLSKQQYSLFSFSTQKELLAQRGIPLFSKPINYGYEARIYLLFDFYSEAIINLKTSEIEKINLAVNGPTELYFD